MTVKKSKEEVLEEFRCASIRDAAMTVIARKGVAAATMQEIADEAGIAKGTIYVYFRDRDELLTKTAGRAVERLVEEIDKVLERGGTLEEKLTALIRRQLEFFDEHRELFTAYHALSNSDGTIAAQKRRSASFQGYRQRLVQVLAEAKEAGELGDVDAAAAAEVVADCIRGAVIRLIEKTSKAPHAQEAELLVSILLRGIQA